MLVFTYKAKKENAETVVGDIEAHDADEAIELVNRMGLLPISVHEKTLLGPTAFSGHRAGYIRRRDILVFTSQLVSLLKSAVPLLQSIELLSRKTRNAQLSSILSEIAQKVRNGKAFSACVADYPLIFSPLYVAMARAGEESGRMFEMMADMAEHYRKQEEIAAKIRTALTYPAIMLVVGIGTIIFILTFVLPKIKVLFKGLHAALPLPTLFVIRLSELVQSGWLVILIVAAAGILLWRSLNRTEGFKRAKGMLIYALPLVKDFAVKVDMQRFARTMSLLLASGIPILRALGVAIPTLSNEALKDELRKCQTLVEDGASFGETLRDSKLVPDIVPSLISVGEESGSLAQSLKDIADTYEQEIGEATKAMTTLLEPLLILAVGAIIAFIVFAMLMPIFQMDIFAR